MSRVRPFDLSESASRMRGGSPNGPDGMNALQRAFVGHLTTPGPGLGCATRAADLAGYRAGNRDSLAAIASRVLRNPNVARAVEAAHAKCRDAAERRRAALVLQATLSTADFLTLDDRGQPVVDVRRAEAAAALGLVKRFKHQERTARSGVTVTTIELEVYDPLAALKVLFGMDRKLAHLRDRVGPRRMAGKVA